jgi:hypothetical protein
MTRGDLLKAYAKYLELRDLLAEHGMLGRSDGETEAAENNAPHEMTNPEAYAHMLEKHSVDLRPTDEERQHCRDSRRTYDLGSFIRDRYGMDVINIEAASADEWDERSTALRVAMTARDCATIPRSNSRTPGGVRRLAQRTILQQVPVRDLAGGARAEQQAPRQE